NNRLPSVIIIDKICGRVRCQAPDLHYLLDKIGCISEQKNQRVVFLFSQFALSFNKIGCISEQKKSTSCFFILSICTIFVTAKK
uniref:hypothetical protein n=1 Tax=Candidatus Limisoma sp. TaxID=3076476 RepID=UPI0040253D8B